MNEQSDQVKPAAPTLWQVLKSVLAASFGVQSESARERDFKSGKIGQFIIVALLFTLVFIVGIYLIAKLGMSLAG